MSNPSRKRKRVDDDLTSSNSHECGFDAVALVDDVLSQMRILDGYVATLGKSIFQDIVATLEKAKIDVQRNRMPPDEMDSDDDGTKILRHIGKVVGEELEKKRLRRLARLSLTGNQESSVFPPADGEMEIDPVPLVLERQTDLELPANDSPHLSGDASDSDAFSVNPDKDTKSEKAAKEFGLEDGHIETEHNQSPEDNSLEDGELPETDENPSLSLESAIRAAIDSNPVKKTKKSEKQIYLPRHREPKTEPVSDDDDELVRPYDSDISDSEMDNERERSAFEDSNGDEYLEDPATTSRPDKNSKPNKNSKSDENTKSDKKTKPDKKSDPKKDLQSSAELERLKRLSHGELISNILHSKKGLNCGAFIALKAKKERRLLSVVVESNGTVKLAVAKLILWGAPHQKHYVNIMLTSMAAKKTPDKQDDVGVQLVSLISILMHGYDVSESSFDFKLFDFDFDDRHNSLPFKDFFKASSEKITIRYMDMGKNKVLAPLLCYVHPKFLHIRFPSLYMLDSDMKLMIGEIDELHLDSDIETCVDSLMDQCRARDIYLSHRSVWTDNSIKKVLTEHACDKSAKSRKIHGNCSKGFKLQLRSGDQWKYLWRQWKVSCWEVDPTPNVGSVHIEIPRANKVDAAFYINLDHTLNIKSEC